MESSIDDAPALAWLDGVERALKRADRHFFDDLPLGGSRQRDAQAALQFFQPVEGHTPRQIVRVLWLLKALGEGAQVSVSELARRFGTRRETIYRDLRALEDIGCPIQGDENGRLSRPRLLDSGRGNRQEIRLTRNEYLALGCMIKQSGATMPLTDSLASAAAKLKALQSAPAEIPRLDGVLATSRAGVK